MYTSRPAPAAICTRRTHMCMHASTALLVCPSRSHLGSSKCVATSLALTSGCKAGRQSSRDDTHCPGPASPSRRLGSACCRRHSFLWCRRACREQGTEGSGACEGAWGKEVAGEFLHLWHHLSLISVGLAGKPRQEDGSVRRSTDSRI